MSVKHPNPQRARWLDLHFRDQRQHINGSTEKTSNLAPPNRQQQKDTETDSSRNGWISSPLQSRGDEDAYRGGREVKLRVPTPPQSIGFAQIYTLDSHCPQGAETQPWGRPRVPETRSRSPDRGSPDARKGTNAQETTRAGVPSTHLQWRSAGGGAGSGERRRGAEGMRWALCRDARPGGRVVPISLGVSLTRGSALRRGFRTGPSSRPKMQ